MAVIQNALRSQITELTALLDSLNEELRRSEQVSAIWPMYKRLVEICDEASRPDGMPIEFMDPGKIEDVMLFASKCNLRVGG